MFLSDITWTQLGEIAAALGAVATIIGVIVAWIIGNRKIVARVDQDPIPEIRKAAKRYNHDANEVRFVAVEKTVQQHSFEIEKIKDLFRVDLPAMERRLDDANERRVSDVHERVNEILGEVKEMRGELKTKK